MIQLDDGTLLSRGLEYPAQSLPVYDGVHLCVLEDASVEVDPVIRMRKFQVLRWQPGVRHCRGTTAAPYSLYSVIRAMWRKRPQRVASWSRISGLWCWSDENGTL